MRILDYSRYTAVLILLYFSFHLQSCRPYPHIEGVAYYPSIKTDTLNKYNKHKHRTGYWVECVDKHLIPVVNKDSAIFYRYDYYRGNIMVTPEMGWGKKSTIKFSDSNYTAKKDTAILLNGKVQIFDESGRLVAEGYYKKGILIYLKLYYKTGMREEYVNPENPKYSFSFSYKAYSKTNRVIANVYNYWINEKQYEVDSNQLYHTPR